MDLVTWFWERVDRSGDCWEWHGTRNAKGYGVVIRQSPEERSVVLSIKAHRLSYLLKYGPPPSDMVVRHSCDNPPCVNPAHLILGTQMDNVRDMIERGRGHQSRKTHCPRGHAYEGENVYVVPRTGHRQCRTCRNDSNREYARRRRAA